jgi:hypothetical protein
MDAGVHHIMNEDDIDIPNDSNRAAHDESESESESNYFVGP